MNLNVYIKDQLYQELEKQRRVLGKSRSSIVTEALNEWVKYRKQTKWPRGFFKFTGGLAGVYPGVKELREDLKEPKEYTF